MRNIFSLSGFLAGLFGKTSDSKSRVYADYAASTPLDEDVRKVMFRHMSSIEYSGNPSSVHSFGREAKIVVEDARRTVARILQVQFDEVIFTGGGTESDNLAIQGVVSSFGLKRPHIITSVIEHSAVLEPIRALEKGGVSVTYLNVDERGRIDTDDLKRAITRDTVLLSLAYANGEIGTIEDIRGIGNILKKYKERQPIFFHTDASQAAQFLRTFPKDLGVDLMTLDAAKIYGPKGVGVLFVRRGTPLKPIMFGGMQEKGLRAGTQNVPGIAGFAEALLKADKMRDAESKRAEHLRDVLQERLFKGIPNVTINGAGSILPNFLNICIPGVDAEFLSVKLDKEGIAASSASACRSISSSGSSYVIEALPGKKNCGRSSIRFSLGRGTSLRDIEYIAEVLPRLLKTR